MNAACCSHVLSVVFLRVFDAIALVPRSYLNS